MREKLDLIKDMQVMTVKKGDILVLRVQQTLSISKKEEIREWCKKFIERNFPEKGIDMIVLDAGIDMGILRKVEDV